MLQHVARAAPTAQAGDASAAFAASRPSVPHIAATSTVDAGEDSVRGSLAEEGDEAAAARTPAAFAVAHLEDAAPENTAAGKPVRPVEDTNLSPTLKLGPAGRRSLFLWRRADQQDRAMARRRVWKKWPVTK